MVVDEGRSLSFYFLGSTIIMVTKFASALGVIVIIVVAICISQIRAVN